MLGAPIAHWIKRWPVDLAVPGSRPAGGGNLNRKRGSTIVSNFDFLTIPRK